MEERLQKLLARAGYGSRRACESYLTSGRVMVNGQKAELGQKADPLVDKILVDGAPLRLLEQFTYVAVYKPRMILSTENRDDPRRTVRDLVDIPGHLYPVGRLDLESEGLMLLTNDGELADRLTHPRYGHEKEYRVLVARRPDEEQLEAWRRGVVLADGVRTRPAQVNLDKYMGKGAWLNVVMREGRKRQIREIAQRLGLPVVKLIRVRIGTLELGRLRPGEWRYLVDDEIRDIGGKGAQAAMAKPTRQANGVDKKSSYQRQPSGEKSKGPKSGRKYSKKSPPKPEGRPKTAPKKYPGPSKAKTETKKPQKTS